ncbi:MAG: hypothetical protein JW726_18950 [Anaerolineales bacterium]|nr:hypothetical protein [Anaerolineales bacterium]
MFDDFRQSAEEESFQEEQPDAADDLEMMAFDEPERHFLGMTAPQRMIIAFMLLLMTCVLSAFCLLISGRVFPPFLG